MRQTEHTITALRGFHPNDAFVEQWARRMARLIMVAQAISFRQAMGKTQADHCRGHIDGMLYSRFERMEHVNVESLYEIARSFGKVLLVKMVDLEELDKEAEMWEGDYSTRLR